MKKPLLNRFGWKLLNVRRGAIFFNEGGVPVNFAIQWRPFVFLYIYVFGRRFSARFGGRSSKA